MRRLSLAIIAAVSTVSFTQITSAADLPRKAPAVTPSPLAVYNWSGLYIGGSVGGAWTNVDRTYPGAPLEDFSTRGSHGILGFHFGAQWQWSQFVLGVEASYAGCWSNMCESRSGLLPTPPFATNRLGRHAIDNIWTIGPRLGYAWDKVMVYGTGGYALANLYGDYCVASTGACGTAASLQLGSARVDGWFAGIGVEYMLHKGPFADLIVGAEYQHIDLGSKQIFCLNAACSPPLVGFDYQGKATIDIARARLSIKVNPF